MNCEALFHTFITNHLPDRICAGRCRCRGAGGLGREFQQARTLERQRRPLQEPRHGYNRVPARTESEWREYMQAGLPAAAE